MGRALNGFDADLKRKQRAAFTLTVDETTWKRRRLTGSRMRQILEAVDEDANGPDLPDDASIAEIAAAARENGLRGIERVYSQIAQLLEPADAGSLGLPTLTDDLDEDAQRAVEEEYAEWLTDHLDWDDAPDLLNVLNGVGAEKRGPTGA